jgi:hypothetical protein
MSITILPNAKARKDLVLASLVGIATPLLKGTDSEGVELDALRGGFVGRWFTGVKCPQGDISIRGIAHPSGNLYRMQVVFPEGRGGIATGNKETVRRFLFHCDEDAAAWATALVADPRNPRPLEVVPHGERA